MSKFVDKAMDLVVATTETATAEQFLSGAYGRALQSLRAHLESREALVKQLAALLERYVACDVSMDDMNSNVAPSDLKSSNLHRESVAALAAYQEKT
ncbi:MAG: hypothetical protein K0Q92_651 [Steroidobacteraceae bacterium]|jgi:hypothetical protein|nr:hypothetical protein [Steroidobacteraceae bacterium]